MRDGMLPSIHGSQRVNHHQAGGDRGDDCYQDHLEPDHDIARGPDREGAEQGGGLSLSRGAHEHVA